ncbi:C-terminal binding protein [Raineyella sp. W15-4]|uniref:C-terminal binding protein n=1 Tax=Raineyella sp. W15-4 TaxID=3081651 RepID=UPI00295322F9|nr:C-terminal binding protein [Raineyella sp. W15-4]WOQ15738.1 C-terminal binding protein [Raineyella sp. W15-4]
MTPKAVYFNIDGDLGYEHALLEEWGVADRLELVEVKTADNAADTFVAAAQDADGAVVEYFEVTREVLERLPRLKVVSLQAIGVSNVDLAAASDHGVAVTNTPGFCSEDVALHTVGMLIDLVRKISFLDRSVRAGHWDPLLGPMPQRLSGRTIGLVYFGSIPTLMVPMLKAIGLRVVVFAPTKTAEYLAEYGVEKVDTLDELLRASDVVSLHTPLTPQTHHLIGARELELMKPTGYLINTARGAVVDEPALVAALRTGGIAGAAVDVIEDEDAEQSDLFGLENVVVTPHAAFVSEQSLADGRRIALSQLVQRLVDGRTPDNQVNTLDAAATPKVG